VSASDRSSVSLTVFDSSRADAELVETHVSTIAFDGELVHKRKKPVKFAFIDLSTPARREEICRREVQLNRRFSRDVYLGVEDVVDSGGVVVDHAVLMRRMPDDRRLASMMSRGENVSDCLRAVARTMAACHAESSRNDEISAVATPSALHKLWAQNLEEIAPFVSDPLDPVIVARVGELAHRYLDGRATLLTQRIADGQVVDGHGDLLADDIFCLDDGPRILDALEFDDRLRWGDVLYDVGFLAMDLERLGRPDLAAGFLASYAEHAAETHPASLEHHYVAYRALVRSKISCLRRAADEACAYLGQCVRHLLAGRIQLVVIGGLPGTGKSSLANALGEELRWPVLRTDEVRTELAGIELPEHRDETYGEGLYAPAAVDAVYVELFRRARTMLERGSSVILDGSFSRQRWRSAAAALAADTHTDFSRLCCVAPADVAAGRLARRAAAGDDPSDATATIAARMADAFDEWADAMTVPTEDPVVRVASAVLEALDVPREGPGTLAP
jgi:aminoglycoside phosphotransferase family enzyme/predicted kinase